MSNEIRNLEPQAVWEYFYQLTQVPRPSKHEARIQDFMVKFGNDLGLETIKDEVGNIIIRKPATAGMEDRKAVVLQGHLDMVPQANSDKKHDFTTDPIEAYIDGDWVTARGTTLGADNGMGVAAAMAVLASKDIAHGPVEALFTSDEETGMTGAFGLKPGVLKGDILINMDSEDEGELYVGCAGGIDGTFTFDAKLKEVPNNHVAYRLSITGLKGGHSGMDIILERGNANKILFRFLHLAAKRYQARIMDVVGGSLRNAIPREAFATVVVPEAKTQEFLAHVSDFEAVVKKELASADPGLSIKAQATELPEKVISDGVQSRLTKAVNGCPNGVIRMSIDMPGLVETSSNLAVVKLDGDKVVVQCLLRSSVDSAKDDLATSIGSVFRLADAEVSFSGAYPGWKPNMDSEVLKLMQNTYKNMYGRIPDIKAIHAGLECGLLGGVYPNWDMISFGPTIRSPHSPDEKVHIESVGKFFNWLTETLKNIPKK
ncbi:MAG: cytosol nonspecific dipeptidase [Bacteroidetes bacterium HGW-Bacteroidetes-4]|jgi:dipeptidase D|nr:MAG: cytosol nonspecific dipeptidase [Bacteroidetes bacterium HGW-Bacteroidetes-4]